MLKFYGYRSEAEIEDLRLDKLKKATGCRNNSQLFRVALEHLEKKILRSALASRNRAQTNREVNHDC